jgi:hypothetical protein
LFRATRSPAVIVERREDTAKIAQSRKFLRIEFYSGNSVTIWQARRDTSETAPTEEKSKKK